MTEPMTPARRAEIEAEVAIAVASEATEDERFPGDYDWLAGIRSCGPDLLAELRRVEGLLAERDAEVERLRELMRQIRDDSVVMDTSLYDTRDKRMWLIIGRLRTLADEGLRPMRQALAAKDPTP